MAMDVSPANADDVYIAGIIVWRSTNGGTSFSPLTEWFLPNSTGYNHADVHGLFWVSGTLYSISDGGLYKSTDNGDNWTDLSTGLGIRQFYRMANSQTNATVITGGAQDNGSVTRQASGTWADWLGADGMEGIISPTNHLNIWGTSQNGAFYRSTNGGASYTGLGQPSSGQWVTPFVIHPTNETILYGGWTGVYKSTNSGTSWTNISAGVISTTLSDLAISPSNPTTIYATTGNTLYVTTNDGGSWTTRTPPATINDIAVDPTNPSKIWIACNSTVNRVLVSTDAGATWTNISGNLPAISARTVVVDDNADRGIYVGMNIGVFYKTETDASWTDYSTNLPLVAINELEIQKASGKIRVATYGRGIWESPVASVAAGFSFNNPAEVTASCPIPTSMTTATPLTATFVGGFSNSITLSASGNPAGTTVSFSNGTLTPGTPSTNVTLNNTNTLSPGSYAITITGTASGATTQTRNIVFTINNTSNPAITAQPVNQTVCAGSNVTFSTTATNATGYQWQVSTNGGTSWSNVSGQVTAIYAITGVTTTLNGYQYRCVVSNSCGNTNTNAATLTVGTTPSVTTQPLSVAVCAGNNHIFTVAASGSGLSYQWQLSTDGGATYNNINGATADSYTANSVTIAMNNNRYRCQVTSATCTTPALSAPAILTVNTLPLVTTQPSSTTVCESSSATFTTAGTGTSIAYQWQVSTNGGTSYTNITGANGTSYTVTATTAAMSNYRYRCVISGTCTPAANTNDAMLTVITPPVVTVAPSNKEICSGGNTSFTVAGSSNQGINYQWQVSTNGGATYTNISGANSATLDLNAVSTAANDNRYRCNLSTATCASPISSPAAVLRVRQLPSVGLVAAPLTSLLPGKTTTLNATPSNSTGGTLTTTWVKDGTAFTNTTNAYVVNVEKVGAYQVRIQEAFSTGVTCSNQSPVVVIDATESSKLFIFPSPNDGNFTVSYYNNGGASTQRTIVVFNSTGEQVYNKIFPVAGPYTLIPINMQRASKGIYFVIVGDATGNKLAEGKVHVR
jgi:hypothetical protein